MISFKIDTSGVKAKFEKAGVEVKVQVSNELTRFSLLTANQAKAMAPVDEGFLRNAIAPKPATPENLTASVVVATNYAAYIEFGTRSFAASYVSSLPPDWQSYAAQFKGSTGGGFSDFLLHITEWVKRKGIEPKAAYPIALSILRKGIKPHPFFYPSVRDNYKLLLERLK